MIFTAQLIGIAFISMIAPIFVVQWLEQRRQRTLAISVYWLMLAAAIYCVAAGLHLATGWDDPFASVDPERVAGASTTRGGRGGLVIFAIRFWPYVLIGLGGYVAYNICISLWNRRNV